jgi:hypothetical protein
MDPCHVLEHEGMDMMRPLVVLPGPILAFMRGGQLHR